MKEYVVENDNETIQFSVFDAMNIGQARTIQQSGMIWVTTQFEGFHRYPDAPEEVSFLRNDHRHLFKVKVWIQVTHDDRDIEFFIFKRQVESMLTGGQMNYKSCEMMSDDLFDQISALYPFREVWIEISEDGENGSFKQYKEMK